MSKIQGNIPAYPIDGNHISNGFNEMYGGMTMLDVFAGQAMDNKVALRPKNLLNWIKWAFGYSYAGCKCDPKDVARMAYETAAAMIEARKQYL